KASDAEQSADAEDPPTAPTPAPVDDEPGKNQLGDNVKWNDLQGDRSGPGDSLLTKLQTEGQTAMADQVLQKNGQLSAVNGVAEQGGDHVQEGDQDGQEEEVIVEE
ncbi:hypothetical protein STEG23_028590, partial [Scotinomys teguina]